jgi:hypothetical protein
MVSSMRRLLARPAADLSVSRGSSAPAPRVSMHRLRADRRSPARRGPRTLTPDAAIADPADPRMPAEDPRHLALAALRDADRFLNVARTTYTRELDEANHERRQAGKVLMGAAEFAAGVDATLELGRSRDGDAVGAMQEVGEALRAMQRACAALPAGSPVRARLAAGLAEAREHGPRVTVLARVEPLEQVVHMSFAELRDGDADEPPLPRWGVDDDEDLALKRAVGIDTFSVVRRGVIAGVLFAGFYALLHWK